MSDVKKTLSSYDHTIRGVEKFTGLKPYLVGGAVRDAILGKSPKDFDLATVIGHGSHPKKLKEAGEDQETILLAVTNSDECNITSCQIAKSKFKVQKTICRLSDSSYLDSLDAFG